MLSAAALFIVAILAAPALLYAYGVGTLPDDRQAVPQDRVATHVSRTYWQYLGGAGEPVIPARNPYSFLWEYLQIIRDSEGRIVGSAEHKLTELASRALLLRQPPQSQPLSVANLQLPAASAYVWVSRHWSANEAIATMLMTSDFGHGFRGMEQASEGYFGVPAQSLDEPQMYVLFIAAKSPKTLDPWCNPGRLVQFFARSQLFEGMSVTPDSINLLPAPPNACAG